LAPVSGLHRPSHQDPPGSVSSSGGPGQTGRLVGRPARRAGRRLVVCVTTKNEREQTSWVEQVEPLLSDDVEVGGECDQEQNSDP